MENNAQKNLDVFSSTHEPYWLSSTIKGSYPSLNEDINVDAAIIGGGITGITTAYILKERGLKVAILEVGNVAQGTTGHTTAKVTSQHDIIYQDLISKFGFDLAKQYADANETAIKFVADLIKKKNIDCDFHWCPAYIYTTLDEYVSKIQKEVEAASKLGIKASFVENLALPFKTLGSVKFDNQARFHPLKYLIPLINEIPKDGSNIYEYTKVVDIEDGDKPVVVTSSGKRVTASKVIIASHFPCYDGLGLYFTRIYQEKSYVIGIKAKEKLMDGMFANAENPGRSLRTQEYEDGEIILVSGEHHKTGSESTTKIHYENLFKFARQNFTVDQVMYRWSTQDCMTVDGLPYTGYLTKRTKNIMVATGFAKWGMTNSTASALIIADLITKGDSPWADAYNPSRVDIVAAAPKMFSENLDVAEKLISGKIAIPPKDINIEKGQGKIIKTEDGKCGAYKDNGGELHIVDTTCTHLGCELVWNEAEETWDCPCHGSRFSYKGENIEGPAFNPLHHCGEGKNKKDPNIF